MAQIRQEINVLDHIHSSGGTAGTDERIQIDTSQYNGTVTYYFEIVAKNSGSASYTYKLYNGSSTFGSITVPNGTANYTLFRSSSFTPTSGADTYQALYGNEASSTLSVKSARVVIIQNATTITNTETQIEIGNASSTTTTTDTALTNPKYWQYTGANWDGTITAYFESTFLSGTSKSAATMTLQESSSITAPSWSNVASSAVTTTSTTATRVRSGAITLTAGNWYRAVMKAGNSKSGITVYNAKIIIDQADAAQLAGLSNALQAIVGGTSVGTNDQAAAQSFQLNTTSTVTGVKLSIRKANSPTDAISIDIVSSLGGTSLANGTISASSLTTTLAEYTITFGSPVSLTGSTTYYIQLTRSPDVQDALNDFLLGGTTSNTYSAGGLFVKNSNVWGSDTGHDLYFSLIGQGGITKLEPQYLLANTLFAAGTSLQTFLTKWDSTEWDASSGTINYYSQAEAADNSTSDVELDTAGGTTITNSTLTNIDNAQISTSALTMPANGNLDCKATTNAGDIAAARILVYYVFSASAPIVNVPYNGTQFFQLLGVGT